MAEMIVTVLKHRFGKVPARVVKALRHMDSTRLEQYKNACWTIDRVDQLLVKQG